MRFELILKSEDRAAYQLAPMFAPLKKLYKSYLKLGFGNYMIPLGELRINSIRSKKGQWGFSLRHYSINGKIKLDNDEKVSPGFFENSGSLYGKKIFKNADDARESLDPSAQENFIAWHEHFNKERSDLLEWPPGMESEIG